MRRLLVAAAAAAMLMTAVPGAGAGPLPKARVLYVVSAHPDDDFNAWSYLATLPPTDYVVSVTMTGGSTTMACDRIEDSAPTPSEYEHLTLVEGLDADTRSGPYRYQGKGSPTDPPEPALGERHPYGTPWVGRGTEACRRARLASWHWFLDDMTTLTPTRDSMHIGDDPWASRTFRGVQCPSGGAGRGGGRPVEASIGCADVWSDESTARVAFRLPEMPGFADGTDASTARFTAEQVTAALQSLRANRAAWGIPLLPEAGVVATTYFSDLADPDCPMYVHPEHEVVNDAIRHHDQGVLPRVGVAACPQDPNLVGAVPVVRPVDPALLVAVNLVDPVSERRLGPFVRDLGWQFSTYRYAMTYPLYWQVG